MSSTSVVCIASGGHRKRVLAKRDALVVEHISLVPPIARRIHATLPASFDLEDLVAAGNFALVRAATRYRPAAHNGTPFSAYARRSIEGAIKDTFRAHKFDEQTRPPIDNLVEFPCTRPVDEAIELRERIAALRGHITACLTPLQIQVFDEYFSFRMPTFEIVGRTLGISRKQVENAYYLAIQTIRRRLAA